MLRSHEVLPFNVRKYSWISDQWHLACEQGRLPAFCWAAFGRNHSSWPCTSCDRYNSRLAMFLCVRNQASCDVWQSWLCAESSVPCSAAEKIHLSEVVPKPAMQDSNWNDLHLLLWKSYFPPFTFREKKSKPLEFWFSCHLVGFIAGVFNEQIL